MVAKKMGRLTLAFEKSTKVSVAFPFEGEGDIAQNSGLPPNARREVVA